MPTVRLAKQVSASLGELMYHANAYDPVKLLLARAFKDHDIEKFGNIDLDVIGPGKTTDILVMKISADYTF